MSAASELRGQAAISAMTYLMNARRGAREIREIAQESVLYADELVSALYPNARPGSNPPAPQGTKKPEPPPSPPQKPATAGRDVLAGFRAWLKGGGYVLDVHKTMADIEALTAEREALLASLIEAEKFIAGFEGDELQGISVDKCLARIRAVIAASGGAV